MASGLMMLRSSVVFVEDHAAGSMLNSAGDRDAAVVVPAVGPFDSSMPAVAAAELMTAALARAMTGDAVASIDRTKAAWAATDTFLKDAQ